ncbi:hypothetical protein L21SP3_02329 [Sedimentisphaera cyanobacteriorum]|uniref:Uncharacterized protein n=1 Tax=Sedimentisphaera cyanobacteriorum TaxID=1940790 RepID=A0A1Q2HT20_9BACT|nr:hypothetical protein [Sedimentisphaera cyanobacteriorum]AQQ10494.1 hypothetical protein L21SP3_02329 [Sedimentisphaera cyanobacteriorum]
MARSEKKKVPQQALNRPNEKKVKIPQRKTALRVSWRFSTVDRKGPFAWPKGQKKELKILSKLYDFDCCKWQEIEGKNHHYLSQESLSKEALKRLKETQKDDQVENLFSFHLNGKERIVAVRYLNVANLLWYDPNHQVSPSTKRHT